MQAPPRRFESAAELPLVVVPVSGLPVHRGGCHLGSSLLIASASEVLEPYACTVSCTRSFPQGWLFSVPWETGACGTVARTLFSLATLSLSRLDFSLSLWMLVLEVVSQILDVLLGTCHSELHCLGVPPSGPHALLDAPLKNNRVLIAFVSSNRTDD